MVLLAAWCSPRLGEVLALTRRDIDLKAGTIRITKAESQLQSGERIIGPPKTRAGVRTVSVPPHVLPLLEEHLRLYAEPGRDGLVFIGQRGGPLRRVSFYAAWLRATKATGLDDLRFHDLRHTGATLAEMSDVAVFASFRTVRDEVPPGHMNVSGDVTVGPSRDDVLVGAGIHQS